jgi:hypothetical protein
MNKLFASVLIAAAVSVSAAASQAMPFESNQTQDSLVVPVAGGCGAGCRCALPARPTRSE